jgi:putative glutamine amidotransferase
VNSTHHQAVSRPGKGVLVSAWAPDGVIEAIELPDHPFALGVQWHPEALAGREPRHRAILRGLVEAALERGQERGR